MGAQLIMKRQIEYTLDRAVVVVVEDYVDHGLYSGWVRKCVNRFSGIQSSLMGLWCGNEEILYSPKVDNIGKELFHWTFRIYIILVDVK